VGIDDGAAVGVEAAPPIGALGVDGGVVLYELLTECGETRRLRGLEVGRLVRIGGELVELEVGEFFVAENFPIADAQRDAFALTDAGLPWNPASRYASLALKFAAPQNATGLFWI
jgi:hypothetical protein